MNAASTPSERQPISVVLVDDSPLVLEILRRMITQTGEIRIAGTATNGGQGLDLVKAVNPDVVCVDVDMPGMDGYELTRQIMDQYPRPILIVSASVRSMVNSELIRKLLDAGAVDVFPKPAIGSEDAYRTISADLIRRIRLIAGVQVFRHRLKCAPPAQAHPFTGHVACHVTSPRLIVIGASTGGPEILFRILPALPAAYPIPLVCVQHIADGFIGSLVERLNERCTLTVGLARHGEAPLAGHIHFPQEQTHLRLDGQGRFMVSQDKPLAGHRPAVDATFTSVADSMGGDAIAILLTGMGRDGAEGMKRIREAGGFTVAQREETCVVYGMPRAAVELGAAHAMMTPEEMIDLLKAITSRMQGT